MQGTEADNTTKRELVRYADAAWWDSLAVDFKAYKIPTPEDDITMRLLASKGLLKEGSAVLDVGCGAGRHSIALNSLGAEVQGIDLSPKMVEYAQELAGNRKNLRFEVADWLNLDLCQKGWEKKFDLVMANMTPAAILDGSVQKMSKASKNWCLIANPTRKACSILDPLKKLAGTEGRPSSFDRSVGQTFKLLWEQGYQPYIEYAAQSWRHRKGLDDAVEQYAGRLGLHDAPSIQDRAFVRAYLEKAAVDGYVEEVTNYTVVMIYWQV